MPAKSDNQPSDEHIDAALKQVLFAMKTGPRAGRESALARQFLSLLATKAIRKAERDALEVLARRCERFGDLLWDIQATAEFLRRSPRGLFRVPGFPKPVCRCTDPAESSPVRSSMRSWWRASDVIAWTYSYQEGVDPSLRTEIEAELRQEWSRWTLRTAASAVEARQALLRDCGKAGRRGDQRQNETGLSNSARDERVAVSEQLMFLCDDYRVAHDELNAAVHLIAPWVAANGRGKSLPNLAGDVLGCIDQVRRKLQAIEDAIRHLGPK